MRSHFTTAIRKCVRESDLICTYLQSKILHFFCSLTQALNLVAQLQTLLNPLEGKIDGMNLFEMTEYQR